MSDRLAELQRQRAIAQEQIAWLDREIAKEAGQPPAAVPPTPAVVAAAPVPAPVDSAADDILAQYRQNPASTEKDVKRGCYLYFACALGSVLLAAFVAYLIYTRAR